MSGSKCWIVTTSVKDGDQYVSHMFCQSKLRGMKCPLEGIPGKKAYVLSNDCVALVDRAAELNKSGKSWSHTSPAARE
ncbi:MAG: hypothetical protein A3K60_02860 [Euryarchaeota archaeon RBG_19FT_COMBO_56_21]|nr:MAG: hypothetical protein A3K60_02860 [Euryarchaeota archaeon RBG_19FT_COMBO_56_21]